METNETAGSVSLRKDSEHSFSKRPLTSVGGFGGVGLGVAPPPPDPILQPEGAALVIEPSPLLKGEEQLIQRLRELGS